VVRLRSIFTYLLACLIVTQSRDLRFIALHKFTRIRDDIMSTVLVRSMEYWHVRQEWLLINSSHRDLI